MTNSLSTSFQKVVRLLAKLLAFCQLTGHVVKVLAAAWLRVLIESAMKDQDRQRNQRKLLLESLVSADRQLTIVCVS